MAATKAKAAELHCSNVCAGLYSTRGSVQNSGQIEYRSCHSIKQCQICSDTGYEWITESDTGRAPEVWLEASVGPPCSPLPRMLQAPSKGLLMNTDACGSDARGAANAAGPVGAPSATGGAASAKPDAALMQP